MFKFKVIITQGTTLLLAGMITFFPQMVLACSVCYGKTDSPMTKGLNIGILTLLAVIGLVLGGFASFFFQMSRRAKQFK